MQQTQTQQPKAMQRQQHAVSKNTYRRDTVLSNEKDEPKMTKARCILRRRCRYLQCVREGEGGAAVAATIKQKTKTKIKIKQKRMKHALLNATNDGGPNQTKKPKPKIKTKQKRMKHALLNATNANSAAQSNATTTTRCIQKHLLWRCSPFK